MKTEIEIPAKEWNAEKGKMEDTSLPEWQKYYADLKRHKEYYALRKPKEPNPLNFPVLSDFTKAMQFYRDALSMWQMDESCFAPNKPGYTRANND